MLYFHPHGAERCCVGYCQDSYDELQITVAGTAMDEALSLDPVLFIGYGLIDYRKDLCLRGTIGAGDGLAWLVTVNHDLWIEHHSL